MKLDTVEVNTGVGMKIRVQITHLLLIVCAAVLSACGGAPGENSAGGLFSGGTTVDTGPSSSSAVTVVAGDNVIVPEQVTTTVSVESVTSTAAAISSYEWTFIPNNSPDIEFSSVGDQLTITTPDVRTVTTLVFRLVATDAAGNRGSGILRVEVQPDQISLSGIPLMYSEPPKVGESSFLAIASTDFVGDIQWTLVSAPDGSSMSVSGNNRWIDITPDVAGDYTIRAQSDFDNTVLETTFTAVTPVTFQDADVRNSFDTDLANRIDIIETQAWIASSTLSQSAIEAIVGEYSGLTIEAFDPELGVVVSFSEADPPALDSLEEIMLQPGVDMVSQRLFEGDNRSRSELVPNDGGAFDDLGTNWHLEYINAPAAWDITTGSDQIMVGISDSGFNIEHVDLSGRVFELLTDDVTEHGTRAVGAIGAVTDNGQGIAGINWVSDMILADDNLEGIQGLFKADNLAVVNSPWAIPGHIDVEFNPFDPAAVGARDEYTLEITRPYRRFAQSHLETLFVWPAGNGIANGSGSVDGEFGIDGRHHSPALHYDDKSKLNKQENVVFAAAVLPDGRLAHYSNYGKSVDIAAPTGYQTTIFGDTYDSAAGFVDGQSGYAGTSASTSVVAGVASLIYSLDPSFSGAEVKQILLESADRFVTERYTNPQGGVESLDDPIPVIDAARALELAQERISEGVSFEISMPDPFTRNVSVDFDTRDAGDDIVFVDWSLDSSADGETNWATVDGGSGTSASISSPLSATDRFHRITADVTVRDTASGVDTVVNKVIQFAYSEINVSTVATVNLADVPGVMLSADLIDAPDFSATGSADGGGDATLYVLPGSYKLRGDVSGFESAATRFTIVEQRDLDLLMIMSPDDITNTGGLTGFVEDESGTPIEDAVVRLSGGEQTNGFFASVVTDANGYFAFTNVSKLDSTEVPISEFLIETFAEEFARNVRRGVRIIAGEDSTENITLLDPRPFDLIFGDDFESGQNGWSRTGFWNRINLVTTNIANFSVDNGNTLLAPNEPGPRALLPEPVFGAVSWWFGEAETGSFIGTNVSIPNDPDGGKSEEVEHEGNLDSPTIDLTTSTTPFLRFRTWWEIESVNPNANGYDLLEIEISTDGGNDFNLLKKLNPFVDPNDPNRRAKGFSSAGFFRRPIWVMEEIDLSDYVGQEVVIRFSFDTEDNLFNGFRGWLIDDLVVGDYTLGSGVASGTQ